MLWFVQGLAYCVKPEAQEAAATSANKITATGTETRALIEVLMTTVKVLDRLADVICVE